MLGSPGAGSQGITHSSKCHSGRIPSIDALRGAAALYILIYHLVFVPKPSLILPAWIYATVKYGFSGVTLFFILSGFTLSHSMRHSRQEPHEMLIFYLKRLFRILPLYYVWLTIIMVYTWGWYGFLSHRLELFLYLSLSYNFMPDFQAGLVWASWFLGVQMLFYLIFPIVFHIVNTMGKALIFLCVSLVAASAYSDVINYYFAARPEKVTLIYFGFFYQLPVFALGVLAYFVLERLREYFESSRLWALNFLGSAVIGWLLIIFFDSAGLFPIYKLMMIAFVYSLLMLGLVLWPAPFLVNKFSDFLGKISYSLYLNHPGIILLCIPVYRFIYSLGYTSWNSFMICIVVTLVPAVAISYVTKLLIEDTGNYLGSLLVAQIRQRMN
jgi:peptidoglycan/LPS O-acetylase OafA/YrhL